MGIKWQNVGVRSGGGVVGEGSGGLGAQTLIYEGTSERLWESAGSESEKEASARQEIFPARAFKSLVSTPTLFHQGGIKQTAFGLVS